MSNTSATGGYLREAPGVTGRIEHEDVVHGMIVGLTGLDKTLVRPAFQHDPLKAPKPEIDWCAFFLRNASSTNFPAVLHAPNGDGSDMVIDWIDKEIHLYFYGPRAQENAELIRRGLHVEQNRYELRKAGFAIRSVGNATQVPEIVNGKWLNRCDIVVYATIEAIGRYAVLNLLQAGGTIANDDGLVNPFDTDNIRFNS